MTDDAYKQAMNAPIEQTNDGGPAFPCEGGGQFAPQSGMTLRDYFAAQMMGLAFSSKFNSHPNPEAVAQGCYSVADLMLAARLKL